jgi:hypothetical protein
MKLAIEVYTISGTLQTGNTTIYRYKIRYYQIAIEYVEKAK